jgi:hypothetical protein
MQVIQISTWIGFYARSYGKRQYSKTLQDGSIHMITRAEYNQLIKNNGWVEDTSKT